MSRIVLDLVERLGMTPVGGTVELPAAADLPIVSAWCTHSGNQLLSAAGGIAVVRRGRVDESAAVRDIPVEHRPGSRLWLYTNFDCNLACDYCCSRSSPKAPRRALGLDQITAW